MKKLIEKLKSYNEKFIQWERKHPFISHLLKVILFIIRAFAISSLIYICVDSIYTESLSISTLIAFAFLVYFFIGEPIDNRIYTEDVLENHLQRIERLEEKTDLLESQQDCIEKWYLNDDL